MHRAFICEWMFRRVLLSWQLQTVWALDFPILRYTSYLARARVWDFIWIEKTRVKYWKCSFSYYCKRWVWWNRGGGSLFTKKKISKCCLTKALYCESSDWIWRKTFWCFYWTTAKQCSNKQTSFRINFWWKHSSFKCGLYLTYWKWKGNFNAKSHAYKYKRGVGIP